MNTLSRIRRPFIALVALAAFAFMAAPVLAQSNDDVGPWTKLDLTEEQRAKVREIVKDHRNASREELHKKLASVLTEAQLAELEELGPRKRPFGKRPGMRGKSGRQGSMRAPRGMGGQGGGCCCSCDDRRAGVRGKRGSRGAMRNGGRGGGGPGPHLGEFREERGQQMAERLIISLDLTDDQAGKIREIVKEHQGQFKDFDRSTLSWEERQKTRDAHRMVLASRIKTILTDEQAEKLDALMETMPGPRGPGRGQERQ